MFVVRKQGNVVIIFVVSSLKIRLQTCISSIFNLIYYGLPSNQLTDPSSCAGEKRPPSEYLTCIPNIYKYPIPYLYLFELLHLVHYTP